MILYIILDLPEVTCHFMDITLKQMTHYQPALNKLFKRATRPYYALQLFTCVCVCVCVMINKSMPENDIVLFY